MQRFSENYLNKLKSQIDTNLSKYKQDESFIEGIDISYEREINDFFGSIKLKTQPSNNEKLDYLNAKILYSGLSHLTLSEAADERLWAFMVHVTHWEYMRKRWPLEKTQGKEENFVLDRYFFKQHPRTRNGLARLWWSGHITYNKKFDDEFYLTKLLMENEDQDISRMLIETPTISGNKKMVEAILISLKELKKEYSIKSRPYIRYAAWYINLIGSVTLWDYLSEDDLRKIINEMKSNWKRTQKLSAVES